MGTYSPCNWLILVNLLNGEKISFKKFKEKILTAFEAHIKVSKKPKDHQIKYHQYRIKTKWPFQYKLF